MQFLENKKIIITGGTGFLGKSILDEISTYDFKIKPEIIITSRGKKSFNPNEWPKIKISLVLGEISELDFPDEKIDLFIHAATSTTPSESQNPEYLEKTVIEGTKNILNQLMKRDISSFIYVSSGAVYGLDQHINPILETDPRANQLENDPTQQYGFYKIKAEKLIEDYYQKTNTPTILARLFSFSGVHLNQDAPLALPSFINQALHHKKIVVSSSGQSIRSYLSSSDLSRWILTAGINNNKFDIFNFGSNQKISIKDLALKIGKRLKVPVEFNNSPYERVNVYLPNTSKITQAFGLTENINLDDQIELMIKAYQKEN